MTKLRGLAVFAFSLAATSADAETPSFDCKNAKTPVEVAICADDALSGLDADLNTAFKAAYAGADLKEALLAGQRVWLAERSDCETTFANDHLQALACLRSRYKRRVAFLKRPMDLKAEHVCHTLADAITFANGYVDGVSTQHSILHHATLDALGAITQKKSETVQSNTLFRQAEKMDPPEPDIGTLNYGPFFYLLGAKNDKVVVSETFGGELEEQDIHYYRVENQTSLSSIDEPDVSGGSFDDHFHFANVPSGGGGERASYVKETANLQSVSLHLGSWMGTRWAPVCLLRATFASALGPIYATCKDESGCPKLAEQALAVATHYDQKYDASISSDQQDFTEIFDDLHFPDEGVPHEKGWYREGPNEVGSIWTFLFDKGSIFANKDTDLIFRVAHGMFRSASNNGYIMGVYRRNKSDLIPIAGFEIGKNRTGLSGPVRVEDVRQDIPLDPTHSAR